MKKITYVLLATMITSFVLSSCDDNMNGKESVVYFNGSIITMTENPDGSPIIADSVLVENGRISYVGSREETLKKSKRFC